MSQLLEMGMLLCFGFAWPVSIMKALKTRSTKGQSILFLLVVWVGYVCGILAKFTSGHITYVLAFYCLNIMMVTVNVLIYFRNLWLDKAAEKRPPEAAEARGRAE